MRGVSIGYADTGRAAQKQRTRAALLDGVRELIANGGVLTVDAAARQAGISRTTAYRYFRSQHELLLAAHPETASESLLPTPAPTDVEARLEAVIRTFVQLVLDTEPQQRATLRASLAVGAEPRSLPLRQGRAIKWISEALEPLAPGIDRSVLDSLSLAVRSATGIEALVWLTDVARLSREEAASLMQWSARAMLVAALQQQLPPATHSE